jgi:cytochrome o ubiquinol oxidase operon protein cyoD
MADHRKAEVLDGDVVPGAAEDEAPATLLSYTAGLGLAVILTLASFWVAGTDLVWGPGIPVALTVLALAQMGVHLVFFLHMSSAPDNTNNILALAFGVLIAGMVIGGSVWIMDHLNQNMMAMPPPLQMQR